MRGYAPGQEIEITIVVDNKSDETFDNFTAQIFKVYSGYSNIRKYRF